LAGEAAPSLSDEIITNIIAATKKMKNFMPSQKLTAMATITNEPLPTK
jgi:hypothetical protein